MNKNILFRPHHFMCTLGFQGHGYSADFVRNYRKIAARLNSDENTPIEVVANMDDICTPCPNRLNEKLCKNQDKISQLDTRHQEVLKLKAGDVLSWKDAKIRIKQNMTIQKFDYACDGCSWKDYGICQKSLERLLLG